MINSNDQPKNNYVLIKLKKKWKKTARITLAIDLVLLFAFILLSIVKQLTDFNSIAFFVMVVIFGVIMLADLVMLFISWYKLYRINSLIAEQENEIIDSNNDI